MNKKVIFPLILAAGTAWAAYDNIRLSVSRYGVEAANLPPAFDGFTIAQVSDLHNQRFGRGQAKLIARIREAKPDMIAVTGDLFHTARRRNARAFLEQAVSIAPCFYVSGNHEQRFADYFTAIKPALESLGVFVLDDERAEIIRGKDRITVIGLSDPMFQRYAPPERITAEKLARLAPARDDEFSILLSHRPELLKVYAGFNVSLVLAGHAHGGQVRFPFTHRGLYAVHQGWFPKYTEGIFSANYTKMCVSRGLGNSTFYPKINNPPELVIVTVQLKVDS